MPQHEASTSSSSRGLILVVTAAALALAGAAVGVFSGTTPGLIAALLCLIALAPLAMLYKSIRAVMQDAAVARQAVEAQRIESERNQAAILRLLDEIAGLGQGDLTATATVTEDITGAIADSVNIAVESLRGLVVAINQDRKSTRLNSSHVKISYAVFCL